MKSYFKSLLTTLFVFILLFNVFGENEPTAITKKKVIEKSWQAHFGKLKRDEVQLSATRKQKPF